MLTRQPVSETSKARAHVTPHCGERTRGPSRVEWTEGMERIKGGRFCGVLFCFELCACKSVLSFAIGLVLLIQLVPLLGLGLLGYV